MDSGDAFAEHEWVAIVERGRASPASAEENRFVPRGGMGILEIARERTAEAAQNRVGSEPSRGWVGRRILNMGVTLDPAVVYLVRAAVPQDYVTEFSAWYRWEHVPILMEEPQWKGGELFVAEALTKNFCALHYLGSERALESDARRRSRSTAWWERLARNDWFDEAFERLVLLPAHGGSTK